MKTIYYLEDDWFYAKLVISSIESKASECGLAWKICRIPTESDFFKTLNDIDEGRAPAPNAFILDVMARYSTPNKNDEADAQDLPPYDRAGIRCKDLVRAKFPQIKLIIYTIFDQEDLPPNILENGTFYITKDPDTGTLFSILREILT